MELKCNRCDGHYVLREGRFGLFAGCSNFPRCNSTIKIHELVKQFIQTNGIKVYQWEKVCWKCGKTTPVYSYYLGYELEELDEYLSTFGMIGLGDLEPIDRMLVKAIPSIKERYSNATKSKYVANGCVHCDALQGRYYIVDDPHEIFVDLWHDRTMDKYLYKTFRVDNIGELVPILKSIYATD